MALYIKRPNNTKYLVPTETLINPSILSNLIRNNIISLSCHEQVLVHDMINLLYYEY